jgi:hypothetical protein
MIHISGSKSTIWRIIVVFMNKFHGAATIGAKNGTFRPFMVHTVTETIVLDIVGFGAGVLFAAAVTVSLNSHN